MYHKYRVAQKNSLDHNSIQTLPAGLKFLTEIHPVMSYWLINCSLLGASPVKLSGWHVKFEASYDRVIVFLGHPIFTNEKRIAPRPQLVLSKSSKIMLTMTCFSLVFMIIQSKPDKCTSTWQDSFLHFSDFDSMSFRDEMSFTQLRSII